MSGTKVGPEVEIPVDVRIAQLNTNLRDENDVVRAHNRNRRSLDTVRQRIERNLSEIDGKIIIFDGNMITRFIEGQEPEDLKQPTPTIRGTVFVERVWTEQERPDDKPENKIPDNHEVRTSIFVHGVVAVLGAEDPMDCVVKVYAIHSIVDPPELEDTSEKPKE